MPKRNCTDEEAIKIDFIVAWAMFKSKVNRSTIAEKFGVCQATVYNWVKRVEDAIKDKIDIEKLKSATLLCYPLALESLAYNLEVKKDASVTNNFLNKTVFADVKESESNVNTNIFNLGAGLGSEVRGVETGKLRAIIEVLRDGDRKTGTPPVVSRIKDSSNN